jgi:hypothetical protein
VYLLYHYNGFLDVPEIRCNDTASTPYIEGMRSLDTRCDTRIVSRVPEYYVIVRIQAGAGWSSGYLKNAEFSVAQLLSWATTKRTQT